MTEAVAKCIKESGNWSKLKSEHKFDHPSFSPAHVQKDIDQSAPKLKALVDRIHALDAHDMKKSGHKFKHFIYSDVKSAYGAKLIASALASYGFHHAYSLKQGSRGMSFTIKSNLTKYNGDAFATLTSVPFFEKPIGITFRRTLLAKYNSRPDNNHGQNIRIIILDSGFKEGVDLFDVKYVHLFEPLMTRADQTQAVGRATRFCGQKGLHFIRNNGWPLYVYRYETVIPEALQITLLEQNEDLKPAESFFDLFMKFSNIDPKKITFANELESVVIMSAVDRYLNRNVHNFSIEDPGMDYWHRIMHSHQQGGNLTIKLSKFQKMQNLIRKKYSSYAWPSTKIENGCLEAPALGQQTGPVAVKFSPTQDFVRHFFTASSPYKGILFMHSVGTGKTCSAIATASTTFEKEGYTIIYVTRHTLKGDVWKNMFGLTCSMLVRDMIDRGVPIPQAEAARARLVEQWIEPMSYKQFSNMITGKNSLYDELVRRNGKQDVLFKTLIIIDEAHKLHAPDVVGAERPDLDAIKNALHHSYSVSGTDSAKLLLMSATPYTDDPMDMMRLVNYMRPGDKQLPEDFEAFSKTFLDEHGKFTVKGRTHFLNEMTGYVSYLNREKDVRSFAHAIIEDIPVSLSKYEFDADLKDYMKKHFDAQSLDQYIKWQKGNNIKTLATLKAKLDLEMTNQMKKKQAEYAECLRESNEIVEDFIEDLKIQRADGLAECKYIKKQCEEKCKEDKKAAVQVVRQGVAEKLLACSSSKQECVNGIKEWEKSQTSLAKETGKADKTACGQNAECKERADRKMKDRVVVIKEDVAVKKADCTVQSNSCKRDVKQGLQDDLMELNEDAKYDAEQCKTNAEYVTRLSKVASEYKKGLAEAEVKKKQGCNDMKTEIERFKDLKTINIIERLEEQHNNDQGKVDFDTKRLKNQETQMQHLKNTIKEKAGIDKSQQLRLETCLQDQKIRPHYKAVLQGKYVDTDPLNTPSATVKNVRSNVYLINGHGSENIRSFGQRQVLPKDKMLVVFPACGRDSYMSVVCKFMNIFNDTKNIRILSNPVKYKSKIERLLGFGIRIYLSGDRVPFLSTNLFFNFEKADDIVLLKSGVFEMGNVPSINRDRLKSTDWIQACDNYCGKIDGPNKYDTAIHHETFKGNVFSAAGNKSRYSKMVSRTFDVMDIMQKVGSGIYFYTGCRSSQQKLSEKRYAKVFDNSMNQQEQQRDLESFKKHLKINRNASPMKFESTPALVQNSPSFTPENVQVHARNVKIVLTSKERKRIAEIRAALKERLPTIPMLSDNKPMTDEVTAWVAEIAAINKPAYIIYDVYKLAKSVLEILGGLPYELHLSVSKRGDHYEVNTVRFYIHDDDDVTKILQGTIGVIPVTFKDSKLKCDTGTLLRRIKTLNKRGFVNLVKLPKSVEAWEDADVPKTVCRETRKHVIKTKPNKFE